MPFVYETEQVTYFTKNGIVFSRNEGKKMSVELLTQKFAILAVAGNQIFPKAVAPLLIETIISYDPVEAAVQPLFEFFACTANEEVRQEVRRKMEERCKQIALSSQFYNYAIQNVVNGYHPKPRRVEEELFKRTMAAIFRVAAHANVMPFIRSPDDLHARISKHFEITGNAATAAFTRFATVGDLQKDEVRVVRFLAKSCPELREIRFGADGFSLSNLLLACSLKALSTIVFSRVTLTENFKKNLLRILAKMPFVFELQFEQVTFAWSTFEDLPAQIRILRFNACTILQTSLLGTLCLCKGLQELEIECMRMFTVFTAVFPVLEKLALLKCEVTDAHITGISKYMPRLRALNLNDNPLLQGLAFDQLPATLQELYLTSCVGVMELALAKLQHTQLRVLDISKTTLVGMLFDCLPLTLQELYCYRSKVTDDAIEKLVGHIHLRIIKIGNTLTTDKSRQFLAQRVQKLVVT